MTTIKHIFYIGAPVVPIRIFRQLYDVVKDSFTNKNWCRGNGRVYLFIFSDKRKAKVVASLVAKHDTTLGSLPTFDLAFYLLHESWLTKHST